MDPSQPARRSLSLPGLSVVSPSPAPEDSLLAAGYRTADRLLRRLLLAHVLLVFALAPVNGTWREALLWGLPVVAAGWFVAWRYEGRLGARITIAASLLIISALIIHQTGGMIEMHFHIFAILAFLLLYRDWRVPVAGAVVVAAHHSLFNALQTRGVGVMVFQHHTGWGIVAVHAAWVVFEVAILVYMARLLAGETRAAEALVRLAGRVGDGDLTARAEHGTGAVGDAVRAVNDGTERLGSAVRAVRNRAVQVAEVAHTFSAAADHVTGAAEEVARALGEVTVGSQAQAVNTQQMAATLGEMARSIGSVADRSRGVAQASERAAGVARDGSRVIEDAVSRLQAIRQTVVDAAGQIAELGAYSDKVERITRVERKQVGLRRHVVDDAGNALHLVAVRAQLRDLPGRVHHRLADGLQPAHGVLD
ncbi:MAG TPA: methyl-accepting chemotaxis protein, partial [Longimicrobium sp.]|nr:methyl-accepting chemotaxis protein [Longimicrobium sp.]